MSPSATGINFFDPAPLPIARKSLYDIESAFNNSKQFNNEKRWTILWNLAKLSANCNTPKALSLTQTMLSILTKEHPDKNLKLKCKIISARIDVYMSNTDVVLHISDFKNTEIDPYLMKIAKFKRFKRLECLLLYKSGASAKAISVLLSLKLFDIVLAIVKGPFEYDGDALLYDLLRYFENCCSFDELELINRVPTVSQFRLFTKKDFDYVIDYMFKI